MKFFIGFMAILALAVLFIDNASGQSPPIASGKFIIEIVMNELLKLKMSADFFANTSHDICRCPGV